MNKESLFSYSFQSFYLAGGFLLFFILLPSFYNLSLGIALSTIGLIILVSRLTDIFTDVFIGYITEKREIQEKNKKHQFIFGISLFISSMIGLFLIQSSSIILLIFFYNLGLLGFTIAIIPYDSIILDQKKTNRSRFKLASLKEGFAILGVIFAIMIPALSSYILKIPFLDPIVIRISGIFFIINAFIGLIIFYFFFIENKVFSTTKVSLTIIYQNVKNNKKIISLGNITFFNLLANNFTANLFIIFVSNYLNLSQYTGLLLCLYFFISLFSIPVWYFYAKKYSNLFLLQIGIIISIFGFALISFLDPKDLILYLLIIFITGVGVGVDLIIPQAELANLLDNNKKNNRLSQIFSTLFSILKKLAIGLAAGISLTGYGLMEENNISFIFGIPNILVFYFLIPILLKLGVLIFVIRYRVKFNDSQTI